MSAVFALKLPFKILFSLPLLSVGIYLHLEVKARIFQDLSGKQVFQKSMNIATLVQGFGREWLAGK